MRISQLDQLDSSSIEHILQFLTCKERKATARISRYFQEHSHLMSIHVYLTPRSIDVEIFQALKKMAAQDNLTLEILENNQRQQIALKPLAQGNFKRVYQIKDGRALVLPRLDKSYPGIDFMAKLWERMVSEEIIITNVLRARGLLTGTYERVNVLMSPSSNRMIPAYKTETFEELSKRGIFILDKKDSANSIWKKGQCFIFNSKEERLKEKNWDIVVQSLLTDIVKLFAYNLPFPEDSVNIAIVKNLSPHRVSPFEIRYFGYDFSRECWPFVFTSMQGKLARRDHIDPREVTYVLDIILWQVFQYEFAQESHETWVKEFLPFEQKLVKKYSSEILSRI